MDAEILRDLMNCSLTKEESKPKISLAMAKAWNCRDIRVSRMSWPILHIFFPYIKEKQRIMDNWPWCFDNHLIIMQNWARGEDPVDAPFDECKFRFHVRGLKEEYHTKEVAGKLSSSLVGCEVLELWKDKGGKKFFRINCQFECQPTHSKICEFPGREGARRGFTSFNMWCIMYGLWIKAPIKKSWVEFRLDDDTGSCSKPSLTWSGANGFSSELVAKDESGSHDFSPGFGPSLKADFTQQLALNEGEKGRRIFFL
ncbi:hypothetical protein LIER_29740 [Lithospermum erythrorhizon]|uniref:Uncharacterized protein n=1 Tax=Lithospermum erythrorhizon TaxID=34254 RepID=A0AAV3RNQ9_LITER